MSATNSYSLDSLPVQDYSDTRPKIKTGDLLFCSGDYPMSKMIQRFTNSPWSHVGIVIALREFDRLLILESVETCGVRLMPLSNYIEKYSDAGSYMGKAIVVSSKAVAQLDLQKGLDWGLEKIGRNYDYKEVIDFAQRIALGVGRHQGNDNFTCSELVGSVLSISGFEFPSLEGGFLSPGDIWQNLELDNAYRIV